ncbi:MAG: hypothetical protein US24_C0025G0006 [candidate division WS6 bacterium GW2011_GWC2_36_7]|uniref:Uncharacterized protein n=1 Tax=candidate division WS6 bacterium GW2011_GWC2_36_7 TaxID=1619091 RepID=A0A0G0EWZ7_9BACT|nr:MAG: hypothetical protein US24_C0025G0006 [candidate division WS6 bacterium GW2011_GWC2_36_7]HAM37396.1 hypothetical protein [Patescibacteria group bacterium]
MQTDPIFYPHTDSTTPLAYDTEQNIQEIRNRLNNPEEAYLADVDTNSLQHPEFVKQVITNLPLFLADSNSTSDSFKQLLYTPYIKEFIADDALIINSASQQILADYLNISKLWQCTDDSESAYLCHIRIGDLETFASLFLDSNGLENEAIQKGLESTLRYFLARAQFQSDIDFDDEMRLLEFLNRHKLNTSIYQTEEIKKLFLEKFNMAIKHKPFRIAGYGREAQTNAIFIANFILGKDVREIKAQLIYALPELLMEPASVWSLLNIEKVLLYKEAKEILKFDFNANEYNRAAKLATKAIKWANDYVKKYPYHDGNKTDIGFVLKKINKTKLKHFPNPF